MLCLRIVKHQYQEMETTEENNINSQPELKQININRWCKRGLGADEPLAHPVAWRAAAVPRYGIAGETAEIDNLRDFDDGQIDGF